MPLRSSAPATLQKLLPGHDRMRQPASPARRDRPRCSLRPQSRMSGRPAAAEAASGPDSQAASPPPPRSRTPSVPRMLPMTTKVHRGDCAKQTATYSRAFLIGCCCCCCCWASTSQPSCACWRQRMTNTSAQAADLEMHSWRHLGPASDAASGVSASQRGSASCAGCRRECWARSCGGWMVGTLCRWQWASAGTHEFPCACVEYCCTFLLVGDTLSLRCGFRVLMFRREHAETSTQYADLAREL